MSKAGDWAGIEEFVAVARAKSFTGAARTLGCSSAHVSREINQLEDRLQQRLLFRTTRSLSLTDAGERFLLHCRQLLEARQEAFAAMSEDAAEVSGSARVTASISYGEKYVAPAVQSLLAAHPKLRVELLLSNDIVDLVDRGIDLAIRAGELTDSGLVSMRIGAVSLRLVASPNYLDRHGAPESLEQLTEHNCVFVTRQPWTFTREGKAWTYRPAGTFNSNSSFAVLGAVLAGLGIGQTQGFHAAEHLKTGRLVELLPQHRPPSATVWAVYPQRRHLPQAVRLLVSHLQQELQAVPV